MANRRAARIIGIGMAASVGGCVWGGFSDDPAADQRAKSMKSSGGAPVGDSYRQDWTLERIRSGNDLFCDGENCLLDVPEGRCIADENCGLTCVFSADDCDPASDAQCLGVCIGHNQCVEDSTCLTGQRCVTCENPTNTASCEQICDPILVNPPPPVEQEPPPPPVEQEPPPPPVEQEPPPPVEQEPPPPNGECDEGKGGGGASEPPPQTPVEPPPQAPIEPPK